MSREANAAPTRICLEMTSALGPVIISAEVTKPRCSTGKLFVTLPESLAGLKVRRDMKPRADITNTFHSLENETALGVSLSDGCNRRHRAVSTRVGAPSDGNWEPLHNANSVRRGQMG